MPKTGTVSTRGDLRNRVRIDGTFSTQGDLRKRVRVAGQQRTFGFEVIFHVYIFGGSLLGTLLGPWGAMFETCLLLLSRATMQEEGPEINVVLY